MRIYYVGEIFRIPSRKIETKLEEENTLEGGTRKDKIFGRRNIIQVENNNERRNSIGWKIF